MGSSVIKFSVFSSMKIRMKGEASFCKLGSKQVPMMMKKLNISSLKCSSAQKDVGAVSSAEELANIVPAEAIPAEELAIVVPAAVATDSPPSFFSSFIEGVLQNLYLPNHSDVIKYDHWKHVAECSLQILFPGPYNLEFYKEESVEKGIEKGSYYEFLHDDETIGRIIMMEKRFIYVVDEKKMESMNYYHVIQKKKLKDAEEEEKKKLEDAEEAENVEKNN